MEPSSSSSSSSSSSLAQSLVNFLDQPFLINVGIVLFLLWSASFFHVSSIWIFAIAFIFLFGANHIYVKRLRRQMRSEGKRSALQDRPLSDFQKAQWLNQAIEKMWPQFLEKAVSQDILGPMIPWFLDKFKPGTVAKVELRQLSLGRRPPMFTGIRIVDSTSGDDHLIMELHLHFLAGEDMTAMLSAQMKGLGIWTNIHISRLLIEGKVRVGIKLLNELPYLSRVRLNFETLPEVQMTVRPLFTHGVNVSDIPLVAGWMDRLVADVFEQCLVQPNMVVVDVEELVNKITKSMTPKSAAQGSWFEIDKMEPVAVAHVKIIEASELKPSDLNGLADPFVKGLCANAKFKTKIEKNTLNPKWFEDFEVPIVNWENLTPLSLRLYDKDTIHDDKLGFCSINLANYKDGRCHDLWITLEGVTTGKLHISVTVVEREKVQDSRLKEVLPPDYTLEEEYPIEKFEVIRLGDEDNGYISIVSPGEHSVTKDRPQRQSPGPKIEKVSTYFEEESKEAKEKNMTVQFVQLSARKSVDGDPSFEVEETEVVAENDIGTDSEQQDDERSESPSKRDRVKNKAKGMIKSMNNHLNAVLSRKGSSDNMAAPGSVQPSG